MAESFPLHWPIGYKRTQHRQPSKFKQTMPDKIQELLYDELGRLKAKSIVVSSNAPLRRDGRLYTEYLLKKIEDPGIAIYFKYHEQDVVMCCDQYEYPWENMYALAKGIEAIRSLNRWGVSEFIKRAFTGFNALPEPMTASQVNMKWYEVLGVAKDADKDEIKKAYRLLAQVHHPDSGGSSGQFEKITKAYQEGMGTNKQTNHNE